jgi:hypothetical protein
MYNQKAFEILSSSISSAVFIDEKAKDFYSEKPIDTQIPEEQLSIDLFNTFRDNGKNLTVHKFQKENLNDNKTIDYLFSGKDLILLDWELDNIAGQEYSLQLLSKSIEVPYINFCCIYSRSNNFNEIPLFLTAYFSGLTKIDFENLKNNYNHLEIEEIQDFWNNPEINIIDFFIKNEIVIENLPVESLKENSMEEILMYIYISLNSQKYVILDDNAINHEIIHFDEDSFIVNNTFVLLLRKDDANDKQYENLIKRISNTIVKNKSSFFQLLGLEMQSVFNSNERFIDETILKSSTEALFSIRNHINDDKIFGTIIKKLLLEQATLKLRTAKLKLLESEFLEDYGKTLTKDVDTDNLIQLNTFFNAVTVKSLNEEDFPNLNFGDIFKDNENNYYLCITALCDCYRPKDGNFYFAKGKQLKNKDLALKLGDGAFISFLPNNIVVYWGDLESAKFNNIDKKGIDEDENKYRIRKLTNEIDAYKEFLYKPFFIKPKVFNVKNNKIFNGKIEICEIINNFKINPSCQDIFFYEIEYITTLRSDYVQRIANHAFAHPVRVGVDFVKL